MTNLPSNHPQDCFLSILLCLEVIQNLQRAYIFLREAYLMTSAGVKLFIVHWKICCRKKVGSVILKSKWQDICSQNVWNNLQNQRFFSYPLARCRWSLFCRNLIVLYRLRKNSNKFGDQASFCASFRVTSNLPCSLFLTPRTNRLIGLRCSPLHPIFHPWSSKLINRSPFARYGTICSKCL